MATIFRQTEVERILVERDDISAGEAHELLLQARNEVNDGADPEEVLLEWFGLEPDYIFDLIDPYTLI